VLLDPERLPGKLGDLVVGEGQPPALGGVDVDERGRAADLGGVGVDHLGGLLPHPPLEDGRAPGAQGGLVDVELVGVHRALHHALAQAVGRGHEHGVPETGLGVHGEHHPRGPDVGADHALHARRQRHRLVVEPVVHPVGDGPVVVEGGVDLPDRLQHRLDAADVEERLLLPGEGGVGQVLRRRAGAHREGGARVVPGEPLVGAADGGLQRRREGLLDDLPADLPAGRGQGADVVGVQRAQPLGDPLRQAGVAEEALVGRRRGGEAVGDADPGVGQVGDHLAERGVLAADDLQVGESRARRTTGRRRRPPLRCRPVPRVRCRCS
jgi:hypothetical protein